MNEQEFTRKLQVFITEREELITDRIVYEQMLKEGYSEQIRERLNFISTQLYSIRNQIEGLVWHKLKKQNLLFLKRMQFIIET